MKKLFDAMISNEKNFNFDLPFEQVSKKTATRNQNNKVMEVIGFPGILWAANILSLFNVSVKNDKKKSKDLFIFAGTCLGERKKPVPVLFWKIEAKYFLEYFPKP